MECVDVRANHSNDPAGAEGDTLDVLGYRLTRNLKGIRAVGVEHLDAIVSIVGHSNDPAGAKGDT